MLVGAVLLAPGSCAWSLLLLRAGLWDNAPIPTAGLLMCLAQIPALPLVGSSLIASWRFTVRRPGFWALILYGLCFVAFINGIIERDLLIVVACGAVATGGASSLMRLLARPLHARRG